MISQLNSFIESSLIILLNDFSVLAYLSLFAVIFIETGIVIAPFLPGDSLLFLTGTIIANRTFVELIFLFVILSVAAIAGDNLNYTLGKLFGKRIIQKRMIKKDHLDRTAIFYKKYGAKTIVIARFIPIVRTLAPFLAGIAVMDYRKFILYNILGGISWVFLFLFAGYLFGAIPIVKQNLSGAIIIIIIVSLMPLFYNWIRHRKYWNKK